MAPPHPPGPSQLLGHRLDCRRMSREEHLKKKKKKGSMTSGSNGKSTSPELLLISTHQKSDWLEVSTVLITGLHAEYWGGGGGAE